jgi:uncharacterized repeat protein (TIGR03806 family)
MRRTAALPLLLAAACAGEEGGAAGPRTLAEWGLFADAPAQAPAPDVVPYEVIAPLFSDYAAKHRFIRVPAGAQIGYRDDGIWDFPVGTVLVKTFAFPADLRDPASQQRLIETRLLVREDGRWRPYVYRWDDAQREATLHLSGARVAVEFVHGDGASRAITYRVPDRFQCENCHGGAEPSLPLGPKTAQLDRPPPAGGESQIDRMAALGLFAPAPPPAASRKPFPDPFGAATLEARARAYLDANCAGCHRPDGQAGRSGLWLGVEETDPLRLGICKPPLAAGQGTGGRRYAVFPGRPDESIMIYRMESDEPGVKMPELPVVLPHVEGARLVRDWIAQMTGVDCR